MGLFGNSAKNAVKKRARNINQIRASRDASENALFFGNSRKGQDAMDIALGKKKSRGWNEDERKQIAGDKAKANHLVKSSKGYFNDVKTKLKDPTLSKEEKNKIRQEARDKHSNVQQAQDVLKFDSSGGVEYGAMDRAKAAGTAVGQYYFGGSGKQMGARIGGTAAAIIGVPMALDAADGAISNMRGGGGGGTSY